MMIHHSSYKTHHTKCELTPVYSSRLIIGVRTPTDDPNKPFLNVHVGAPAVDIHLRTGIGLGKLIVGLFTSAEGLNIR